MRDLRSLSRRGQALRYRRALVEALPRYRVRVKSLRFVSMDSKPVFRVDTDAGPLAAKFHDAREHELSQTLGEMQFLRHLSRSTDLCVETPLANADGELVTQVRSDGLPEPAHVGLCTWLPGRSLRDSMSARSYLRLGECAALLHRASRAFRPRPGFRILTNDRVFYWDAETILSRKDGRLLPRRRQDRFRRAAQLAGKAIRGLWKSGSPIVIHNDLHPGNIKVHRGRLSLYDFEDIAWGFPEQDIGTAMYYARFRDDHLELLAAFREGYERALPWPFESDAQVDRFVTARLLMLANYVVNYDIRPLEHLPHLDEKVKALLGSDQTSRRIEVEPVEVSVQEMYDGTQAEYDAFLAELDRSLSPRPPDVLYEKFAALRPTRESLVLDAGCRHAKQACELHRRFGCRAVGIDLVEANLQEARRTIEECDAGRSVEISRADIHHPPFQDETFDLVWCRDVLAHMENLPRAFEALARVLKPTGRALLYAMFATELLTEEEAAALWPPLATVPENMDRSFFESALTAAGLSIVEADVLGSEWREYGEETDSKVTSKQLLRIARMRRNREQLVEKYGEKTVACELANCHWGVYQVLGKLSPVVYTLVKGVDLLPLKAARLRPATRT